MALATRDASFAGKVMEGSLSRSEGRNNVSKDDMLGVYHQSLRAEEDAVLREALYMLQGISGHRMKLHENQVIIQSPAVTTNFFIPSSLLGSGSFDALKQLGEAGRVYHQIQLFIQTSTDSIILRALQQATQEELQSYLEFLARLEAKQPTRLRQILIETRSPRQHLHSLATIVLGVAQLQGHDVLTALSRHARHGDPRRARLALKLLQAASTPWRKLLYEWVLRGSLSSSSSPEFFVTPVSGIEPKDLWQRGYILHIDRVPTIMDKTLAEQAFQVGKGIDYIRLVLNDDTWAMDLNASSGVAQDDSDNENKTTEAASKTSILEMGQIIRKANQLVHSYILESLWKKHALMDHLLALKQFLLLGQGDFYSALFDGLYAEYRGDDSQQTIIHRYKVASIVDSALRSTNAKDFDDQMLGRLQVVLRYDDNDETQYMFAGKPRHDSKTVWELFGLEYTLPDPLIAIIDSNCMHDYQDIFQFLFDVRRVEYMLNATWRQSAVLQHALQIAAQTSGIKMSQHRAYAQANILLRQVAMTRQAMTHFVVNLKSYLFFEVMEDAWKKLNRKLEAASTLDDIVGAHAIYLKEIKRQSMLMKKSASFEPPVNSSGLNEQLHALLQLAKAFCAYQHRIFAAALEAADRAAERRKIVDQQVDVGRWGFEVNEMMDQDSFFGLSDISESDNLAELRSQFNAQIQKFLLSIDRRLHMGAIGGADYLPVERSETGETPVCEGSDDLDSLRFLKFQLNSNGFHD